LRITVALPHSLHTAPVITTLAGSPLGLGAFRFIRHPGEAWVQLVCSTGPACVGMTAKDFSALPGALLNLAIGLSPVKERAMRCAQVGIHRPAQLFT
jgi:hypothetical protein